MEESNMLIAARTYLGFHYDGLYNVTRMRDYPDGTRLYGSPLHTPTGPVVSVRVRPDGTIVGLPTDSEAAAVIRSAVEAGAR